MVLAKVAFSFHVYHITLNFLFCFVFLMWTIFKWSTSLNLLQYCLFFVLVFWPWGMWNFSFLIRDWTHTPCIGRRSLHHWTAREVASLVHLRNMCCGLLCTSSVSGTGWTGMSRDEQTGLSFLICKTGVFLYLGQQMPQTGSPAVPRARPGTAWACFQL